MNNRRLEELPSSVIGNLHNQWIMVYYDSPDAQATFLRIQQEILDKIEFSADLESKYVAIVQSTLSFFNELKLTIEENKSC